MVIRDPVKDQILNEMIDRKLKPLVKKIDAEAYYPALYLRELGSAGLFTRYRNEADNATHGAWLIEQTARTCMTTAFNLWCHFAAMTYLRNSCNRYLNQVVLPLLENGKMLGGTGLSNPMKYYAGMEPLHLKANRSGDGYLLSGKLPSVSNLGPDHGFGVVASVDESTRIMAFIPCTSPGLTLRERTNYLGLNGSATYMCQFEEVFVPREWIISEQADEFVTRIRPEFLLYQIPLGLGVSSAAIRSIRTSESKQNGSNHYLPMQPDSLELEVQSCREAVYRLASSGTDLKWESAVQLRLQVVYLTLQAVQANMLHTGSAGYIQGSGASRRLREAYFLANLTPTVRHLERMLHLSSSDYSEA